MLVRPVSIECNLELFLLRMFEIYIYIFFVDYIAVGALFLADISFYVKEANLNCDSWITTSFMIALEKKLTVILTTPEFTGVPVNLAYTLPQPLISSASGFGPLCRPVRLRKIVDVFCYRVITISACAQSHPTSIATRYVQRRVLMSDPNWNRGFYYDGKFPRMGMKHARYVFGVFSCFSCGKLSVFRAKFGKLLSSLVKTQIS